MMDLLACSGQGNDLSDEHGDVLLPCPIGFWAIPFDITQIFQHGLFSLHSAVNYASSGI